MRVLKRDTGRKVRVLWNCVGEVDSLLLEVDPSSKSAKVFDRTTNSIHSIDFSQITAKGNYLNMSKI